MSQPQPSSYGPDAAARAKGSARQCDTGQWSEYNGKPGLSYNGPPPQPGTYRGSAVEYAPCQTVGVGRAPGHLLSALMGLTDQTDRLHDTLRVLRERLGVILAPVGPSRDDGCAGPLPQHSELTEMIHAQSRSISNASDLIDELLNRVEV